VNGLFLIDFKFSFVLFSGATKLVASEELIVGGDATKFGQLGLLNEVVLLEDIDEFWREKRVVLPEFPAEDSLVLLNVLVLRRLLHELLFDLALLFAVELENASGDEDVVVGLLSHTHRLGGLFQQVPVEVVLVLASPSSLVRQLGFLVDVHDGEQMLISEAVSLQRLVLLPPQLQELKDLFDVYLWWFLQSRILYWLFSYLLLL